MVMRKLTTLALFGLGYMAFNALRQAGAETRQLAAPRGIGGQDGADRRVRQAGTAEMRNPPRKWDRVDEEIDESFPASDPPSNY